MGQGMGQGMNQALVQAMGHGMGHPMGQGMNQNMGPMGPNTMGPNSLGTGMGNGTGAGVGPGIGPGIHSSPDGIMGNNNAAVSAQQQQSQMQHHVPFQPIVPKRHETVTLVHIFERFYDKVKHESTEISQMDWSEATGPASQNILGEPSAQSAPVPTIMIPQGMVGQMPNMQNNQGNQSQTGGSDVQMMPLQMMQRGFFQHPPMGGGAGQMVPVAAFQQPMYPNTMQSQGPQNPQRGNGSGGGFNQQPQGGQQSVPRGKGQGPTGPAPEGGPQAVQMAFVPHGAQGYPQAFMMPTAEPSNDTDQY